MNTESVKTRGPCKPLGEGAYRLIQARSGDKGLLPCQRADILFYRQRMPRRIAKSGLNPRF